MSLFDSLLLDPYRINLWIALRTDSVKGSGTQDDPYDGSTAAKLDTLLNSFAANTTIHFGPGTFQISGFKDLATTSWVKSGMKIYGSGVDVTTLQMVSASMADSHYYAIGHPYAQTTSNLADYFEVSDLTIDCNLAAAGATTACGAVRLLGNHARVRRVKVINWGRKGGAVSECFVLAMLTADPASGVTAVVGCGIEECIAVTPGAADVGPTTVFHVGPKDDSPTTDAEGYGVGPFIRNCYVDCGSPTATPEYRGLSMAWCRGGVGSRALPTPLAYLMSRDGKKAIERIACVRTRESYLMAI